MISQGHRWSAREFRELSNQFHTFGCLLRVHNNSAECVLFDIVNVVMFIGMASFGWAWCSIGRLQWSLTSTWKKMSRKHFCKQWEILQLARLSCSCERRCDCYSWPICGQNSKVFTKLSLPAYCICMQFKCQANVTPWALNTIFQLLFIHRHTQHLSKVWKHFLTQWNEMKWISKPSSPT